MDNWLATIDDTGDVNENVCPSCGGYKGLLDDVCDTCHRLKRRFQRPGEESVVERVDPTETLRVQCSAPRCRKFHPASVCERTNGQWYCRWCFRRMFRGAKKGA